MRRVYWVWAVGLLLKLVGASWDVAWHFRYLRESLSPPHVINLVGELFVGAALFIELRDPAPHRRVPLLVILVGAATFLFAIPFDQWWHLTFGIDITTWSPAHLLLFSGTAIALVGIVLMFLADMRHEHPNGGAPWADRVFFALLLIGLAESFAFPLAYNEYTTVAAPDFCSRPVDLNDPLSVSAYAYSNNCADVTAAILHGTHPWLYPVYSVVFAIMLATLVRASLGPGWATVMMLGLSAERALANGIIAGVGWPAAVVPLQYVPLVLALELAWLAPVRDSVRAGAGAIAGALAAYAYLVAPLPFAHVPIGTESLLLSIVLGVVFALAMVALARRWPSWEERVPVIEWERYPDRVREWWHAR